MEAQESDPIACVEPHVQQTYTPDDNLNEKTADTPYIYPVEQQEPHQMEIDQQWIVEKVEVSENQSVESTETVPDEPSGQITAEIVPDTVEAIEEAPIVTESIEEVIPEPNNASGSLQIEEISEGEPAEEGEAVVEPVDEISESEPKIADESIEITEIPAEAEVADAEIIEDVPMLVVEEISQDSEAKETADIDDGLKTDGNEPVVQEEPVTGENQIEYVEEMDESANAQNGAENVVVSADEGVHFDTTIEEENVDNPEETLYVMYEDSAGSQYADSPSTETPLKPRRGRKPKQDIPMHVLGHDISKPVENVLNGKSPKPRLGVKVPYRNLTSQIVSKQEIENEIVERGRKKQEQSKSEMTFAKRLSTKLAKKLSGTGDKDVQDTGESSSDTNKPIGNNSDLLAILEGDGDDIAVLPKAVAPKVPASVAPVVDESNIKNLEREIALQQLQELPHLSPRKKFMTNRQWKELGTTDEVATEPASSKTDSPSQTINSPPMEVEPQIKVNVALKTYSRKRKSSDPFEASPEKKQPVPSPLAETKPKPETPDSFYVTKSSRVIKKKVIWDPDETPSRPLKATIIKMESPATQVSKPLKTYEKSDRTPDKSAELAKIVERKLEKVSPKEKIDKKEPEKVKKPQQSPVQVKKPSPANKPTIKYKKSRSEVDKLLGDEGAIKMLYELKNTDESDERRKSKTVISVEKTFKDLAKKANEIKSDLVNTSASEGPKSLRKKDGTSPTVVAKAPVAASAVLNRQKSKDSNRSSLHTPPASPGFSYPNETSYLIRRRSSSSLSSSDNLQDDDCDASTDKSPKKKSSLTKSKPVKIKEEEPNEPSKPIKMGNYKTLTLKKTGKHVTIDLDSEQTSGYFTVEMLHDLTTALNRLSKEKDCNVVLLKSNQDKVFNLGLDYRTLIADKDAERKTKAGDLAHRVGEFVKCLLRFPKRLVAGVQGECSGLGVTMLPLFDAVVSSDSATFGAPYESLGCVPEAGFLLTCPFVGNPNLADELLFSDSQLTADEASRRGLGLKVCWPEKYQETVKQTVQSMAKKSKRFLEGTKKQLWSLKTAGADAAVDSMVEQLIEDWTSGECQKNFGRIE